MEEILQNLKQSYSENKIPSSELKQFKLYSNLSITQPIQKRTTLSYSISNAAQYLSKSVQDLKFGFQSKPQPFNPRSNSISKISAISENINDNAQSVSTSKDVFHPEIYTSILALDILTDEDDENIERVDANLLVDDNVLKSIRNFILPDSGISTFNIFKQVTKPQSPFSDSSLSSAYGSLEYAPSWVDIDNDDGDIEERDYKIDDDDENIKPASIHVSDLIPDDCNTSALAISILLKQGILEIKPTTSLTELLLSNCDDGGSGVIQQFLNGNSRKDPISCTNVLYLYYLTEMNLNYEENVESTEIFLLETLNKLLTQNDLELEVFSEQSQSPEEENNIQLHHSQSPDALLYFLSRVTAISDHAENRFSESLIALLDKRIGSSHHSLDLAWRILAAGELGLLTNEGNWIRRRLEEDCDTLVKLQNDDGSWPEDLLFTIENTNNNHNSLIYYVGKDISTVFAYKALRTYSESLKVVTFGNRLMHTDFVY